MRGLPRFMIACVLTISLLSGMPPAKAQATGVTWYLHNLTSPDGAESYLDHVPPNSDEVDNTATATAATGSEKFTLHSQAQGPTDAEYAVAAGTEGLGKVWIKSWNSAPAPDVVVTMTITADGTTIASGASPAQDVLLGAIVEFDIPLAMSVSSIASGAVIAMDVDIQTEACGCYLASAYPRGSSVDHPWQFLLPLAGSAAGGIVFETLEGAVANVTQGFDVATTRTFVYNWTTVLSAPEVVVDATIANGTLTVAILDGANSTAYSKTFNETGTDTAAPEGTAGLWQITIGLDQFVGNFTIMIQAPGDAEEVPEATNNPGDVANDSSPPGTGKSADDSQGPGGELGGQVDADANKGSPGPEAVLVAVGILGIALLARRRR